MISPDSWGASGASMVTRAAITCRRRGEALPAPRTVSATALCACFAPPGTPITRPQRTTPDRKPQAARHASCPYRSRLVAAGSACAVGRQPPSAAAPGVVRRPYQGGFGHRGLVAAGFSLRRAGANRHAAAEGVPSSPSASRGNGMPCSCECPERSWRTARRRPSTPPLEILGPARASGAVVGAKHRSCREARRHAGRLAPAGRGSRPERGARRHASPLPGTPITRPSADRTASEPVGARHAVPLRIPERSWRTQAVALQSRPWISSRRAGDHLRDAARVRKRALSACPPG